VDIASRRSKLWQPTFHAVRDELGTDDAIEEADAVLERIGTIECAIMEAPAFGVVGLAVKARVMAIMSHDRLWDKHESDLDWDDRVLRNLIESVCATAGVSLSMAPGSAS
jgi:hypothetical protein